MKSWCSKLPLWYVKLQYLADILPYWSWKLVQWQLRALENSNLGFTHKNLQILHYNNFFFFSESLLQKSPNLVALPQKRITHFYILPFWDSALLPNVSYENKTCNKQHAVSMQLANIFHENSDFFLFKISSVWSNSI